MEKKNREGIVRQVMFGAIPDGGHVEKYLRANAAQR